MTIREIEEADIAACLSIYGRYIENTSVTFEESVPALDEFKSRVMRIAERYPFLVAVENGRVVGYAYLDTFNERTAYRRTADLSVYLDKDDLHKGVGKLLYAELERRAVRCGIKNIVSVVTAENENSLRFHERLGFRHAGTLTNVGCKFGRLLSVKYLQKELDGMSGDIKLYTVSDRTEGLMETLLRVWEGSVKATHDFLTGGEIDRIKSYVPHALRAVGELVVAENESGAAVAFIGIEGRRIEMLFVAPEERGKGIGRALIKYAEDNLAANEVTVNEQNIRAVGFYEHMGFRPYKRTELDEQGDPYPLLYMRTE